MSTAIGVAAGAVGRLRWSIVAMLFAVTIVNYADRATLGIAGPVLAQDLRLSPVQMGVVFSAFGWAYVIGQLPGGWLLDRFGSKRVYFAGIFLWSAFTFMQGWVGLFGVGLAFYVLFGLRFLVGFAEAPSFPANARIVAAWFPATERGTASAIFNAAQYFATALFAPILGYLTVTYGWPANFYFMGLVGVAVSFVWLAVVYSPRDHPRLARRELDYIAAGGALVDMDRPGAARRADERPRWAHLRFLVSSRMMIGIYLGQFCINAITYFLITWFPIYLVQQRGMSIQNAGFVASVPAVCGFAGGILGGFWSDFLLRRGWSLTWARKTPIVAGMLLAVSMVLCNYVDTRWLMIVIIAVAFFGKGIGALGWAVLSDTAPKQIAGVAGGLFNMFGNLSSITTPIVVGAIVQNTGSFDGALMFIGANALVAILSFVVIVQDIRRLELP